MNKKILVISFFVVFAAITLWLYLNIFSLDRFPLNSNLPINTYQDISGMKTIDSVNNGKIMIVLFSLNCQYCKSFMNSLEKNISNFHDYRIYLLAQEEILFEIIKNNKNKTYSSLGQCGNVHFGYFSLDGARTKFGTSAVPSIFVFANKKLIKKFNGSPSINRILN